MDRLLYCIFWMVNVADSPDLSEARELALCGLLPESFMRSMDAILIGASMQRPLVLAGLLALASCGYDASDTAHQAQINTAGMTSADLQSCAGVPDKTAKIDDHTQIFTYNLKNDATGGVEVTLPLIGGGYKIGGSGSNCTANFRLVDNKVAALFYSGNNDRPVGEDGVCEPIIRGCMRRPQSSMLPVSQQTDASAFSQPPAPPTPIQAAAPAPAVDPDAVVRMPTVGR